MKNWLKNNIESLIVLLLFISLCVGLYVSIIVLTARNTKLKLQILEERVEYTEAYYDDYIELLEEIYYLEIDNSVYEERIKWLEEKEYGYDYIDQMYEDFAEFSYLAFNFEGSESEFQNYMIANHIELYQRILLYQKVFG